MPRKTESTSEERIARLLGAETVLELDGLSADGPLDLLALRRAQAQRVARRPPSDESRPVHLQRRHWRQLERLSEALTDQGQDIAADELASALIERALAKLIPDQDGDL